jgi:Arc/MetJ-type ribon-helix-helix transcriptional regulator
MQTIQLNLPDSLVASMDAAIASGAYNNKDEIANFVLSDWSRLREGRIAELRALWEEGVASGIATTFTLEDMLSKIRNRTAEKKSC